MRCSSSGVQIFVRLLRMSVARLRVNVVKSTLPGVPELISFAASQRALCIATTVLPVPAPPSTRTGPFQSLSTKRRWLGCRNTRHCSMGAESMASSTSSSVMTMNSAWLSGVSSADATSVVSTLAGRLRSSSSMTSSIDRPSASRIRPSTQLCGRCSIKRLRASSLLQARTAGSKASGTPSSIS